MINQKVSQSREKLSPLPDALLLEMCDFLLSELGEPVLSVEKDTLRSLHQGDYDQTKRYCLADPCNEYLAVLSCIASAYRSPMVADSILRDAARHVAEVAKLRTGERIRDRFLGILKQAEKTSSSP